MKEGKFVRLLICGDREWTNKASILKQLKLRNITVIISGRARGADTLAEECGSLLGIALMLFPANWDYYHKAAGPIRNQWMLNFGKPDEVWAFHSNIGASKGTADMVRRAKKANIRVRVFSE
jgi:hypothetical protein